MSDNDIKEFAERVERLCDFLLSRLYGETGRHGSDEQIILEELKEEATSIKLTVVPVKETLTGLKDFMGGMPPKTKEL